MMSQQSIDLSQAKLLNNNKNVIKNKRKKKRKCVCCSRILRPDESLEKIVANERMIFLSSVYPPVIIGHNNCIQSPTTTPKHKGFLSEMENYSIKWTPGAVTKYVAVLMEQTKAGTLGPLPGRIRNNRRILD
ncbi:uncharacterized protein LOC100571673 [Acyrthosiphon pisum]|uniref:Uncharacterized protein n=1 Tax=Acyrthosiphon pisum TaxID=7029 RepID=A0A8R1W5P7_ACYPI|nr:uncharacterized protein LOC100571673 [Acyrthosiphon pisum]|eukprot:XP_003243312.1 PREDICTED: uncharacterized protein LOC100571673 [Acyrthosiphon pisum]